MSAFAFWLTTLASKTHDALCANEKMERLEVGLTRRQRDKELSKDFFVESTCSAEFDRIRTYVTKSQNGIGCAIQHRILIQGISSKVGNSAFTF